MKHLIVSLVTIFTGILVLGLISSRKASKQIHFSEKELPANIAELGEELFFDPILSGDNSISCASCHKPEFGFADNKPLSEGVQGMLTSRNTPTVMYRELSTVIFWDGRARSLEHQTFFPITHNREMGSQKDGV